MKLILHSMGAKKLLATLGLLIKEYRASAMSQDEFAQRLGVSRKTVSNMEQGKAVNSEILFDALSLLKLDQPLLSELGKLRLPDPKLRHRKSDQRVLDNDF
ncbi:helix-turn-helix transcriptional regulator [Lacimicrobium alkaliphilum]|uniref:HTH cro/C1-type domain-containing protein n=1 Tax=Lacimicrobium alkaliphilum TaxID=1526571 RepID=A0ABQ1RQY3_9ALTE|nr:helix-turn-helix transcriptional regulator [Lacimicrobium alkaliphilum]GGD75250.1 hypothetical protein GCM10011357_32820 [Lacimicrobium alkaliphilum]